MAATEQPFAGDGPTVDGDDVRRDLDALRGLVQEQAEQIVNLEHAVASRDVIGQAKGIIMHALGMHSDEAFHYLVELSQRENRKLTEIAAEFAAGSRAPREEPT